MSISHIAQHLNNKGIELRESSLQSKKAQKLWKGIRNNFADFISFKKNNNLAFLKIGEKCILNFEQEKPVVSKNKMK